MTSDKAIKTLQLYSNEHTFQLPDDLNEAQKLGIEALKFWQAVRPNYKNRENPLLPGETGE